MENLEEAEKYYQSVLGKIGFLLPDGFISIELETLSKMGLLDYLTKPEADLILSQNFHMVETKEKITLVNEDFGVWIVPSKIDNPKATHVLIALYKGGSFKLEAGFWVTGVYNTSTIVVRVLEKILTDIQENEDLISHLQEAI